MNSKSYSYQKDYMAKYAQSEKGIASRKRAQDRYNKTDKAKTVRKKYRESIDKIQQDAILEIKKQLEK